MLASVDISPSSLLETIFVIQLALKACCLAFFAAVDRSVHTADLVLLSALACIHGANRLEFCAQNQEILVFPLQKIVKENTALQANLLCEKEKLTLLACHEYFPQDSLIAFFKQFDLRRSEVAQGVVFYYHYASFFLRFRGR